MTLYTSYQVILEQGSSDLIGNVFIVYGCGDNAVVFCFHRDYFSIICYEREIFPQR